MYVYCTNTIPGNVGDSVPADTALDSENPAHAPIIAQYLVAVEGDLGGVPGRVSIKRTEVGYVAQTVTDYELVQLKAYALNDNKLYIDKKRMEGCPTSFGYPVSCQLLDIQNMSALVDVMVAAGIPEVDFRDHLNDTHKVTLAQLKQILLEVYQYGIVQYQVKWSRETQIKGTSTYEELEALLISWGAQP